MRINHMHVQPQVCEMSFTSTQAQVLVWQIEGNKKAVVLGEGPINPTTV